MTVPKKYIGLSINSDYIEYLEKIIGKVSSVVNLSEEWCKDQDNGLTDGSICMGAMKDIRRFVKDFKNETI